MNIAGIDYNLNHKALELYISGCTLHCDGCHNEELWDFTKGNPYFGHWDRVIHKKLKEHLVENVWIMGGEPLDQDTQIFYEFICDIFSFDVKLWLWTGYEDVPDHLLWTLDYIKVGEYQKDSDSYTEPLFGIELASVNQKIIKVIK